MEQWNEFFRGEDVERTVHIIRYKTPLRKKVS